MKEKKYGTQNKLLGALHLASRDLEAIYSSGQEFEENSLKPVIKAQFDRFYVLAYTSCYMSGVAFDRPMASALVDRLMASPLVDRLIESTLVDRHCSCAYTI